MGITGLTYNPGRKLKILAFLLIFTSIMYGIFEFFIDPETSPEVNDQITLQSVNEAVENFNAYQVSFRAENQQLTQDLVSTLGTSDFPSSFNDLKKDQNFWGISVFQDTSLIAWTDFGIENFPVLNISRGDFPIMRLGRDNNVTFLEFINRIPISEQGSVVNYYLVSRSKIQQSNLLSIGNSSELEPSELFAPENEYPVKFSFFESPPANINVSRPLYISDTDSVGLAYTLPSDSQTYIDSQKQLIFLYRAGFWAIIILFTSLLLISVSENLRFWSSFFLKLFAVLVAWLFFINIEVNTNWLGFIGLQTDISNENLNLLFSYCVHSIFVFLLTAVSFRVLAIGSIEMQMSSSFLHIVVGIVTGLLSTVLLFFVYNEVYQTILHSNIPVLDLEVFPELSTLIFYLATGTLAVSSTIFIGLIGWFVIRLDDKRAIPVLLSLAIGFVCGLYILTVSSILSLHTNALIVITSFVFFTVIVFLFQASKDPLLLVKTSQLRLFLLICFIAVSVSYIAFYQGYSERLQGELEVAAEQFISEEATEAERIAQSLLISLQQQLTILDAEDLNTNRPLVDNIFRQSTESLIQDDWETFSISAQLINNEGEIISDYSSDLNSPAWTRAFNMFSLVIPFEAEQIRFENLRPIIRDTPLNEVASQYSSFRRAWIPIYDIDDTETRIGWILCSVYRERPQFEKPLRAVMAMQNNEQWSSSISVTEYINGVSARKNIVGPPLDLPGYLSLPEGLLNLIGERNEMYRDQELAGQTIQEYFIATSDEQIIRAATKKAGFNNHFFSILRFYFVILFGGSIILGIIYWRSDIVFISPNKRFRDRLIDRFIIASLVCLLALIITTYYTVKSQNQKAVQNELLLKTENLTEAITNSELENNSATIPLFTLASTLDADASLYRNNVVDISTTGQIYNQHLLPNLLPWDVYDAIINRGSSQVTRKITLGDQELLIGYQPWLNENGEIAGIVSIPTFLEAPIFNEQLLTTTSYLIGLFVLIFSFFILGASLISTQLTSPLEALRKGLKKISGGDLETTLPVKSQDEIGSLINAYNIMVYRLKDLQTDLAEAEREAAWKEMAQQVAHEIKNPLTPMKLNLQHLERQISHSDADLSTLKPKIRSLTANIIEQIESLNKIASDFSKFAKPVEQEFEPIEINELVSQIGDLYGSERDIQLQTSIYEQELWVQGVKDELRRVMINLVKNAREAMPNGGRIHLITLYDRKKELVTISVSDTGEGIDEESREKIFIPNFSTKSSGTGLGLAIAKKIITEHGGQITFQSTVNEGSTFSIILPISNSRKG
jgi:signal transduction histidine kinase